MASSSKKSSGKKSGGKKSSGKKASAAGSGNGNNGNGNGNGNVATAEAALLAVSKNAADVDSKESDILHCLVGCFFDNGFPAMSPSAKIVWATIPDDIIITIGDCIRECLTGKGYQSISWGGPFLTLKSQNKVTVVSSLVTAMANVVQP